MSAKYTCPYCLNENQCDCKTCSKDGNKDAVKISWDSSGEIMICGYCHKKFSPDQMIQATKKTTV